MNPRSERFREEYQGKHFFTKDGKQEFVITDARSYNDVDIEFIGSGYKMNTKVDNIKKGFPNPFYGNGTAGCRGGYCPIIFDTPQQQYEGCLYKTSDGDTIKIIKFKTTKDVTYQIQDEHAYIGTTTLQNIRKGEVRNPFTKNSFGGYLGANFKEYSDTHTYNIWKSILTRSARDNVLVDPSWMNFSVFANWYTTNLSNKNPNYKYDISENLLYPYYYIYTRNRRCHSAATSIIIPNTINTQLSSIDKNNKRDITTIQNLYNTCEIAYRDGALEDDAYCIIKRFYLNDPQYANYISTRVPLMSNIYY